MENIVLVRIDMRLIHGQVIAKWVKQLNINKIFIVDDEISKDKFLTKIYKSAAPPSLKVKICSVEDFIAELDMVNSSENRILILFKNVTSLMSAWKKGFEIETVQIGGLGGGQGRKIIHRNITVSQNDMEDLLQLHKSGVKIVFQAIPEEPV
ncbi:MAG TPA: PTS sugar transporter subunit IIB, partial [Thermoanaerobacterales bacterium]|nr:PTS sugar transporter subunit IIB [Thermoanaerobacterales bacterium]